MSMLNTSSTSDRSPLSWGRFAKRALDLVGAAAALIFLSPVFFLLAVAIKFDSAGPVIIRQARYVRDDKTIDMFKFRSMITVESGEWLRPATKDDPRCTSVGRFLRRTNLDELPQLLNVLCGEMSIVGPRPHSLALHELFKQQIASYPGRFEVKPGITGWAQVNGYRGGADTLEKMQRRIELDLYYVDHWSLAFDIKIVLMTLLSKTAYSNAY